MCAIHAERRDAKDAEALTLDEFCLTCARSGTAILCSDFLVADYVANYIINAFTGCSSVE